MFIFILYSLFFCEQISRYNTSWLLINGSYINYALRENERQKHWASFLLVRGNSFVSDIDDKTVQFHRMTRSQSHTPPHLSNCLLFSIQKNHTEWEMTMEGQPFCSEGEPLPMHLFWNCFYYLVLGFQSLNFSYDMGRGAGQDPSKYWGG